jgi:hypothetical protein
MATKTLKSIKGRHLRLTKLDSVGAPVIGTCSTVVTDGFVKVTIAGEVEAGQEYTSKNAWGDFCISEKDADRFKWVNVTVDLCDVDPDVIDIMGGEAIIPAIVGTNTVGFAVTDDGNTQAFAIEVWTKKAEGSGAAGEWGYFVVPAIFNGRVNGDVNIENAPLTFSMTGQGQPATSAWGTGPYADQPYLVTSGVPVGALWGQITTTVAPPTLTNGCAALAALPG